LDAKIQDTPLPACTGTAVVYGVFGASDGETTQPLQAGQGLPVTQGFQGFLFVRVGVQTVATLPPVVHLTATATLDGGLVVERPEFTIKTHAAGAMTQTGDVPIYFNDSPLPWLIGRKARVEVRVRSTNCTLAASTDVVLAMGSYMAADAGFWRDAGD
jgi:hypothetical protein